MTLSEAGAATSAEASGAKNVGSPHIIPVGAAVATPVCMLTEPAATTDCGKDNMQLVVSAATSDWAPGTNSTETLSDTRCEVTEANSNGAFFVARVHEQVELVRKQRKTAMNRKKNTRKRR
jgi:hypothetical protein